MEEKSVAEILVVDDHSLILEGICRVLNRIPGVCVADAVTSGTKASALIAKRDYDLYILDVSMPDMSGFDLIALIRQLNADARIIINTMHEEVWMVNRLAKSGVNAILLKSVDSSEMETAVLRVLAGDSYTCARFESIRQQLHRSSARIHAKDKPTNRELEVLRAIAQGMSTLEIASSLNVTENTVETFRRRLINKFDAKNSIDLVMKAVASGWIDIH